MYLDERRVSSWMKSYVGAKKREEGGEREDRW